MGSPNRRFTPEEDRRIEALRIDGLTHLQIARRVGRGKSSITARLNNLAMRDDGL